MILVDDGGGAYERIDHSPWNGCTLADFVMPFFLFIVGVAIAFALKVSKHIHTWIDTSINTLKLLHRSITCHKRIKLPEENNWLQYSGSLALIQSTDHSSRENWSSSEHDCREFQISAPPWRRLLSEHWKCSSGVCFSKVILLLLWFLFAALIPLPVLVERFDDMYKGGYSHAPDDLSYGVDMKKIRWCGILQVHFIHQ